MKFSLSKKDQSMLIGLVGILILAAVWYFVVSPLQTDTDALETENIGLKSEVELYQTVNANLAEYQQGIEKMNAEMDEIMEHYPANITRQDEIMFLSNMEDEYSNDIAVKSIAMGATTEISVTTEAVPNAGEDTLAVRMFKQPTTYNFKATYDGVKTMITHLATNTNKKAIESVSLSFDSESGNLQGTLGLAQFFMTGTEKAYTPIKVPSVRKGVDDVFHTVGGAAGVNSVLDPETEDAAETEDAEAED